MKKLAVAVPLVLSMLVTACGGGGGGGSPAAADTGNSAAVRAPTTPAAAPAATPVRASAPFLQPGALSAFGPRVIATNIDNQGGASVYDRGLTSAARLAGGGAVVAWSTGSAVLVQRLDEKGNSVGAAQMAGAVLSGDTDVNTRLSVAATTDGGWVVAWVSPNRTVLFGRYDASGAPVAPATAVDTVTFTKVRGIQARALADGGFVVAWAAAQGTDPSRAFLRRFDAAGSAVTDRVGPGDDAGDQPAVQVTPLPDGNFLAAWVQGNPDGTDSLLARRLDAGLKPAGPQQVLGAPSPQHPYSLVGATTLSGGAALFAWSWYDGGAGIQVRWQLVDALGAPTIPAGPGNRADFQPEHLVDSVQVVPAASGFRIVAESAFSFYRGTNGFTTVLDVDAKGELLARTDSQRALWYVNPVAGTGCNGPWRPGVAAAGGEDGRYLLAYATCPSNVEVVAR